MRMRLPRNGAGVLLAMAVAMSPAARAEPVVLLYEDFEPVGGDPGDCEQENRGHWDWTAQWEACDVLGHPTCPDDPDLPADSAQYGPLKFESWPDLCAGGQVFSGYRSGRQPIWDPYWGAMLHRFDAPGVSGTLRLKAWQYDAADILCDCDEQAQPHWYTCDCDDPEPPPWPNRPNFRVQGWIMLNNPDRSEYYVLGVNTHQSWTHVAWATKTDGWNVSGLERVKGWRKMEIVVHPYSGEVGDVQFLVDDAVVAEGRRAEGEGSGVPVSWVRLGGDPTVLPESHLTNTLETFWYDEVELTFATACHTPPADADGDGDVDQDDFAAFQRCYTGAEDPAGVFDPIVCGCFDFDGDGDVDADDFAVFAACFSGPTVEAHETCHGALPSP